MDKYNVKGCWVANYPIGEYKALSGIRTHEFANSDKYLALHNKEHMFYYLVLSIRTLELIERIELSFDAYKATVIYRYTKLALATHFGLEPKTFCLTGKRSNQTELMSHKIPYINIGNVKYLEV